MDIREQVREHYAARISNKESCCGGEAANTDKVGAVEVPDYGCGQPVQFAGISQGMTVLDLGSGAGLDVFRAAGLVGPGGKAIGVDMTPEMLERAAAAGEALGLANVEFRRGYIESLPVESGSVDRVISNCVINLSPEKEKVFAEAFRVLKPGGELVVADILRVGARKKAESVGGWCACVDGAESAEEYQRLIQSAGFTEVNVEPPNPGVGEGQTYSAIIRAVKAGG